MRREKLSAEDGRRRIDDRTREEMVALKKELENIQYDMTALVGYLYTLFGDETYSLYAHDALVGIDEALEDWKYGIDEVYYDGVEVKEEHVDDH